MSNGITNLRRNTTVATITLKTVTLTKNYRVGCAVPAHVNILAINFEGDPPGQSRDEGGEGLDPVGSSSDVTTPSEEGDKTTFTCHAGCYRFKRMPFGLCDAPATFQRTLDILLAGLRWKTCLVYLDDVIVFSKTFDEYVNHV